MRVATAFLAGAAAIAAASFLAASGVPAAAQDKTAAPSAAKPEDRGALLFDAAGCANCHTDRKGGGKPLAGGLALETPFGTFHTPNITPDRTHGIGAWSDADFIRAMREGEAPDGSHFYPAFPYTSYTRMTDADMLAIKRHIFAMPAADTPSKPHDLNFPFDQRWLMGAWKMLHFEPGPYVEDPGRSAQWNRGAYLVTAVAHCGECHTPRGTLGAMDMSRWLAGNPDGPEGEHVPNITPDRESGIGGWSAGDMTFMLETGMLPDGDVVGGSMYPVIEHGTAKLPAADREAIAEYLLSLPPLAGP